MGINSLTALLEQVPAYQQVADSLKGKKRLVRAQIIDEGVPFLLSTLWRDLNAPMLIICPTAEQSIRLTERIFAWTEGDIRPTRFGESESLPFERTSTDNETSHQRITTLAKLIDPNAAPPIVVTSANAICQGTIARHVMETTQHRLSVGDEITLSDISSKWEQMGYLFEATVSSPGQASRRGGIIDVFPVTSSLPYRIELWGNQIDSIRSFDPQTQRAIEEVQAIELIPALETLPMFLDSTSMDSMLGKIDLSNCTAEETIRINGEIDLLLEGNGIEDLGLYTGFFNQGSLLDYFPKDGLVVTHRPIDVASNAFDIEERISQLRTVKEERGELPFNFPSNHTLWREVENSLEQHKNKLVLMPWGSDDLVIQDIHVLPLSSPPRYMGDVTQMAEDIGEFSSSGGRVVGSTSHTARLEELLSEQNLAVSFPSDLEDLPGPGTITMLKPGIENIGEGFVLNQTKNRLMVIGDTEIFGVTKRRRSTRRHKSQREAFFEEISKGDYVVHVEHGIARFMGTGKRGSDEKKIEDSDNPEYLILEYSQGDRLYVPLEHLDRVAPYVAPMERSPSLTRLGTQEWNRVKERVERSTREMAAELLALYAERELAEGYAMGPDTKWQYELEESFPYEETDDQISTLSEIKEDMESKHPMDRLVCGDVGYGKTEIALRAAFKAVMEGKQVAVLVPTTVLAQQHFETFSKRTNAFPVNVEVLSRFRSSAEQKKIVEELRDGEIDICIGTHRLVQKDVSFKELGLIIIDEEQRFGVAHKERLKQMRSQVDVLTLTATPIPRTLHMSLAGVRDMSTIETAPEERLPIKTYVSEFSDDLIREAILREMDREGQVYFLHNRVHNIEYMSEYIRTLVPDVRVGIAHGQMSEGELEKSMIAFTNGDTDVLVCTTIIESGLDIPNANTLIVNRSDNFGLAQLYQLRGRIGRSSKRGYSYLLIPRAKSMSEPAERRLKAMLSATELGSGFKIAMKDLEIRGAGNILGAEQSGHIHAVGFDLYTRLLATAVEDLRAKQEAEKAGKTVDNTISNKAHIDLRIPAGISQDYVSDLTVRLDLYQRLVKTDNVQELELMNTELRDRFGPIPWQASNLIYVTKLKLKSQDMGADSITKTGEKITLQFPYEVSGMKPALTKLLGDQWTIGNKQLRTTTQDLGDEWETKLLEAVEKLSDFRTNMNERLLDPMFAN